MSSQDDKYRRLMRYRGKKCLTDAAEVTEHVRRLREHPDGGMTCQAIADAAGVALSTVSDLSRCDKGVMRDSVVTKILAVQYQGITTPHGAWTDPTGTQRRLHALYAVGIPCTVMAEVMGNANPRVVWNLCNNKYVTASVAQRVKAMYEKLRYSNPDDLGVYKGVATRNRNRAAKLGWAPPMCWDDDTIDSPDAIAEWTGACGTMRGWQLHYRHKIPQCPACREAKHLEVRSH